MPIIQNITEHDFHLPIFRDLTRKPGESVEDFNKRVAAAMDRREGEEQDEYEARLAKSELIFPKKKQPKGNEGDEGYEPGGPTETKVTADQLEYMKKHRVARKWFGGNVRKGQGLIILDDEEETKRKGKAA